MADPVLADYEYQFKETGLKLNSGSTLPFWDVKRVSGLGMAEFDSHIDELDGMHGGQVFAKFAKARTIVVEGVLYANPSTIEVTIDAAIANYTPDDVNYAFYYKHPGVNQRLVYAKSLGLFCDTDELRRIGAAPFQIQLAAENPVKLQVQNLGPVAGFTTIGTYNNNGNTATFPIFTITGAWSNIKVANTGTNEGNRLIWPSGGAVAGDVTVVNHRTRTIFHNGINKTGIISADTWYDLDPGMSANLIIETQAGNVGTPTSTTAQAFAGWM